jgi:vanillate O-demethylase monooxygenase subunit
VDAIDSESVNELDVPGEAALYGTYGQMWHPVAMSNELQDKPLKVVLLDNQLVLVRLGGEIRAFADLCVHRGTALSLGWIDNGELRCAYHGWTFDGDGVCTSIPAAHGPSIPKRARLRSYLASERYGLVWVCLHNAPVFDMPVYPQFDDPNFRVLPMPTYEWNCGAARRIENFVDLAHIAWVHDGVIGSRDRPEVPDHDVHRVNGELRMSATMVEPASVKTGIRETVEVTWRLFMPFTVLWNQQLSAGREFGGIVTVSPMGRKRCKTFTLRHLNYEMDDESELVRLELSIAEADRIIAESQRPEELPIDLTAELHIKGADKISIAYRRWLVELRNALRSKVYTG